GRIYSIATDPQDWRRVYVVTATKVLFTADITNLAAHPFVTIGGGTKDNLDSLSVALGVDSPELRSIAIIDGTPVVGGLGGVYRALPPSGVAGPSTTWSEYGAGIPNVVVRDLDYDATTDTLVAGTMGRGAWIVPYASATITTAPDLTVTKTHVGD